MEIKFRPLRADEIECRISQCSDKFLTLLLYKDARADMRLLDETVGPENWQRSHEVINGNLFCNVGIWFDRRGEGFGEWVWKQDVGTESNTEKEKGQASDSFKRACTNWGIGRELYTAPDIRLWADKGLYKPTVRNGKPTTYDRFKVSKIGYTDGNITTLQIKNASSGKVVFNYSAEIGSDEQMASAEEVANAINNQNTAKPAERTKEPSINDKITAPMVKTLRKMAGDHKMPEAVITERYRVKFIEDLTFANWRDWAKTGEEVLKHWDETHKAETDDNR